MTTVSPGPALAVSATAFMVHRLFDMTTQSAGEIGLTLLKELGSLGLLTLVLWKIGPMVLAKAGDAGRAEMAALAQAMITMGKSFDDGQKAMADAIKEQSVEIRTMRTVNHDLNYRVGMLLYHIDPKGTVSSLLKTAPTPTAGTSSTLGTPPV